MALIQALQIYTMYISNNNGVNVSFSFDNNKVAKEALLDSDTTDNFIDQQAV